MKVSIVDVSKEIFAGGDVPKDRFSIKKTEKYSVPVYANAEKNNGLYGYTDLARVSDECVTVAARGTIGYCARRYEPFLPCLLYTSGRRAWLVFLSVGIILTCVVLYDVNVRGNAGNYGGLAQYLTINDDWGTHRWYIWRIGMESYGDFSIKQKIFGAGPDTYGAVVMENYYDEMVMRYGEFFDSAHN